MTSTTSLSIRLERGFPFGILEVQDEVVGVDDEFERSGGYL